MPSTGWNDIISNAERQFVLKALRHDSLRCDGRRLNDQRRLLVMVNRSFCKSRAEVVLGRTRVLSVVSAELVTPFPDHPTEGFLAVHTEFSPMASAEFEVGRPSEEAIELRLLLERGLKEGNSLDLEALCVVAGESVWSLRVDVRVLDHGGNITDASALSVIAALLHFRRPQCSVAGGGQVTVHSEVERIPSPLSIHHIPICVTFGVCCCLLPPTQPDDPAHDTDAAASSLPASTEPILLLDPSRREELVAGGAALTLALNAHGELCTVQKNGGTAVGVEQLLQCVRVAALKVQDVMATLKTALADGEKRADQERLSFRPAHTSDLPASSPFAQTTKKD